MKKLFLFASTLLFTALIANAQTTFGTIAGLVKTPAKAPVAGAMITASRADGSSIRSTISGSDGLFTFADVAPGEYSVKAENDGFIEFTLSSIAVSAGKATRADFTLTPALAPKDAPALISSTAPKPAQPAVAAPAAPVAAAPATVQAAAPVQTARQANQPDRYGSGGFNQRRPGLRDIFLSSTKKPADADAPVTTEPVTTASIDAPPASAFSKPFELAENEVPPFPPSGPAADPQAPAAAAAPGPAAPPPVDNDTPFAYGDFTWMNAVSRNHDSVLDGKYFSPEIRTDTNYIYDYAHPIDHTLGGTTEGERTGEVTLQQLNVGGDFHWDHMQMRVLTQFGATATAVPRNDASNGGSNGQWDLADAYRYLTEGYAGYHMNVQHGLNVQAGIFMSFIGLYSYYSFDNWNYQPSYVSSNTPWFFSGIRAQWFPTNKLKFEPWIINGWQSYGKFNGKPGVGGQILWRPTTNLDFVWNTYALGQDTLGTHRTRLHEDDSMEWKYYEDPTKLMHRMAFSLTFDIGCETGGGTYVNNINAPGAKVNCESNSKTAYAQNFIGAMLYQRFWFGHDHYGLTFGGGFMANPGRYLVLLPPVNGATAASGSPYFTENPGQKFSAYDYQIAFQWMPSQFVTWGAEFTQRGSNVPYFAGPNGMTPPGGNNGSPGSYICNDGSVMGSSCAANGGLWSPDLRKQERRLIFSLMVHL